MNTEMTLWVLLILSLTTTVAASKMSAQIWHLIEWNLGKGMTLWLAFLQLVSVGLYCWLAYVSGWWQFAAISVGTFLINRAAANSKPEVRTNWKADR